MCRYSSAVPECRHSCSRTWWISSRCSRCHVSHFHNISQAQQLLPGQAMPGFSRIQRQHSRIRSTMTSVARSKPIAAAVYPLQSSVVQVNLSVRPWPCSSVQPPCKFWNVPHCDQFESRIQPVPLQRLGMPIGLCAYWLKDQLSFSDWFAMWISGPFWPAFGSTLSDTFQRHSFVQQIEIAVAQSGFVLQTWQPGTAMMFVRTLEQTALRCSKQKSFTMLHSFTAPGSIPDELHQGQDESTCNPRGTV